VFEEGEALKEQELVKLHNVFNVGRAQQ